MNFTGYYFQFDLYLFCQKNAHSFCFPCFEQKHNNQYYKKMDRIWRSKTTFQPKPEPKKELLLPNQIGCRIIELEMEMDEGNISKEMVIELLHQYTKAVEFYEEKEDDRYKLYQRKIQNLLQKPTVNTILKGNSNATTAQMMIKKQKTQEEIRKASTQNKVVVKKMMEFSEQGAQKQKKIIKKQLDFQLKDLQDRLQRKRINSQRNPNKRKITSMSFSATSTQPDLNFMGDFQQVPQKAKSKVYM